jgi:MEMO1 family protein
MIREPSVAGQFYAATKHQLELELQKAFRHQEGAGANVAHGIIAPHAGYMFSGACAAQGYRALKNSEPFDAFLILGFSHAGLGAGDVMMSGLDWKTPLGIAVIDSELASQLLSTGVIVDERPHREEHSIEVQLPFLQYLFKDVSFIPLAVAHEIDHVGFGMRIAEVIKASKRRIAVIASSDFTHYGFGYSYVPFQQNIPENLKKLDMGAVSFITKLDGKGFLEYVAKTGATICGARPIALQMEIMRNLGTTAGELLSYTTSGEVTGDFNHSVSYVSICFPLR